MGILGVGCEQRQCQKNTWEEPCHMEMTALKPPTIKCCASHPRLPSVASSHLSNPSSHLSNRVFRRMALAESRDFLHVRPASTARRRPSNCYHSIVCNVGFNPKESSAMVRRHIARKRRYSLDRNPIQLELLGAPAAAG